MEFKLIWSQFISSAPELSYLALCLLSVGISEAAVERSFSQQKFTHSEVRNKLEADIVEAEMRIKFNEAKIKCPEADTGSRKRKVLSSVTSSSAASNGDNLMDSILLNIEEQGEVLSDKSSSSDSEADEKE